MLVEFIFHTALYYANMEGKSLWSGHIGVRAQHPRKYVGYRSSNMNYQTQLMLR